MKFHTILSSTRLKLSISGALLLCGISLGVFVYTGLLSKTLQAAVAEASEPAQIGKPLNWKMVTSWPRDFPVVGTGANNLAESITKMSGGRLVVTVYGAGELGGGLDVLDMVRQGVAEMGHSASFYWRGKVSALQFFGATPYGMNANEVNAWFYHAEGLNLWEEIYAPLGIIPFPAGNTGVQMGGWFNKKINSVADLQGLRMRIPGLGGEVFKAMGGLPVVLPAGEIFTGLASGTLDAAEWSGPANDLPQGFHKAAAYYYYPGWQEPTTTVELIVDKPLFNELPADLQAIVRTAAQAANMSMTADYTYRNIVGLTHILEERKGEVTVLPFPKDVLQHAKQISKQVLKRLTEEDKKFSRVYKDYQAFLKSVSRWSELSEQAYLQSRKQVFEELELD